MEKKITHLQDEFLNQLRKEHVSVSIYLMNGIKLQGNIESFDQYAILLKNTVSQLVYKLQRLCLCAMSISSLQQMTINV